MAEYLDKTGLTHLWSKLKEKVNTMTAEPYKSGVNCVAGKYYTFNNKLYLCTKNTDGTIAVTNTTYFTNTTVGNELSNKADVIDFAPNNNGNIVGVVQLYNPETFNRLGGNAPSALGGRILCYGQRRPWNDSSYGNGYYLYLTSDQRLYIGTLISGSTITWKQIGT